MTAEPDPLRAEKITRRWNVIGLVLMGLSALGFLAALAAAIGFFDATNLTASALGFYVGWRWATRDTGPGTAGSPGTSPGIEIDTEHPDPGAFIPRTPGTDPPGTFTPPLPSRDESRDFERDSSRDRR